MRPFLSLLAVLLLFGAAALLLSMVLPSRRLAATCAGALLVASYFVTSLARVRPDLESIARFSPLTYYETEAAFRQLNIQWFAGLIAVAALFALIALWRFERRGIRIAGEGGWQVSFSSSRRKALREVR